MAGPSRRSILTRLGTGTLIVLAFALFTRREAPPELYSPFPDGALRIGVEIALPPYSSVQNGELVGMAVDLGQGLGRELGLNVHFVSVSHDGRFDALRLNQVDVLAAIDVSQAALEADILATRPWFDAGLALVSRTAEPVDSMSGLAGRSLALALGSDAELEARRWQRRVAPFAILPYELPVHALDAVRLEVAPAALVDTIDARLHMRRQDWRGQLHPVRQQHIAMALLAEPAARWRAIDLALGGLLTRGDVARLLDEWL